MTTSTLGDTFVAPRLIPLDGTSNTRDIGGYVTRDGRTTRYGRILRSDALHALTEEDLDALSILQIGATIDLRFTAETARAPSVYANSAFVEYWHIPLHEPYEDAYTRNVTSTLGSYYVHLVDDCAPQIFAVFDRLTKPQSLPAVVHCTVGKDRTGVIIALILSALGVNDETVIADYALTARVASGLIEKLRAQALAAGVPEAWCERMFGADPGNMRTLLAHLSTRYGGADAYLRSIGLPESRLNRLRANLLA
jgi:protein-tyrosine phosphatase